MPDIKPPEKITELPLAVIKNMIVLATSGFGVVVALAWNELIKAVVAQYIDPLLGKNSGVVSLLIYSIVMTLLAVFITMQLSSIERRLENLRGKSKEEMKK